METIRLSDLADSLRAFFSDALKGDGFVIEDEAGRPRGGFVPYRRPSDEQKQRAFADLRHLWRLTDKAMPEAGVTEEDIDRVLQEDD